MMSNMIMRSNSALSYSALFKGSRSVLNLDQSQRSQSTVPNKKTTEHVKQENIEKWLDTLPTDYRQTLLSSLQSKLAKMETNVLAVGDPSPTYKQLFHVGTYYSIPYIGFGFLDNFVMIIAGDYIEAWGAGYGMSTMAAAGIGNAISDATGIPAAYYMEAWTKKLGFPEPDLTPAQFALPATTWAVNIGRAWGVVIGCLLGMVPLLWMNKKPAQRPKPETPAIEDAPKAVAN